MAETTSQEEKFAFSSDEYASSASMLNAIGLELKNAREERNFTVSQVSRDLKIRQRYIEDIESGDFAAIPGGAIYITGFLRGYAGFLGLDVEVIINKYKTAAGQGSAPREFNFPESYYDQSRPTRTIIIASVVLALVVYGVWYKGKAIGDFFTKQVATVSAEYARNFADAVSPDVGQTRPSELEEATTKTKAANASPASVAAPAPKVLEMPSEEEVAAESKENNETVEPAESVAENVPAANEPDAAVQKPKNARIVLLAKDDTWVKISDTEKSFLLERAMKSGDTYFLPEKKNLVITAGNAEAIEVFIDGDKHAFLGTLKDIAKN